MSTNSPKMETKHEIISFSITYDHRSINTLNNFYTGSSPPRREFLLSSCARFNMCAFNIFLQKFPTILNPYHIWYGVRILHSFDKLHACVDTGFMISLYLSQLSCTRIAMWLDTVWIIDFALNTPNVSTNLLFIK